MSFIKDLIESAFPVAFAEEPEEPEVENTESEEPEAQEAEESGDAEEGGDDEDEDEDEDEDDEDEDEEEKGDPLDELREECAKSAPCEPYVHHFHECVERVTKEQEDPEYAKKAYKEDCVEEFFHLQHCINDCAAPRAFYKLK